MENCVRLSTRSNKRRSRLAVAAQWLLAGLCGCVLLAGCRTAATARQAAQPLLLFQKTPCYGTCPAYDATVYTDGQVQFIGYRYTPVQDTLQLQLSEAQLHQLQRQISTLGYPSLQNVYKTQRTDMPATYLTFYEEGHEAKRIKHQQDGPPALQQFIQDTDALVLALVQERLVEKPE